MPAEINVAVIGLGGKGRSHAVNLAKVPRVRIASLCDINLSAIDQCRRRLGEAGAGAYGTRDPERIFADAKIDGVVIATQHDTHSVLAVAAAQAGKHLLVEKPLALTTEGCLQTGDKAFYQVFDARNHSATMYGTKLRFASGAFGEKPDIEELRVDQQSGGEIPDYEGTVGLVTEFVQCMLENRQPTISGTARDGRRATTMALRAFDSIRTGQPQAIA